MPLQDFIAFAELLEHAVESVSQMRQLVDIARCGTQTEIRSFGHIIHEISEILDRLQHGRTEA